MKTIILASSSPRRRELLKQLGLKFKVEPTNVKEDLDSTLDPHALARKISLEKARAAAARNKNAIVIAADTFGVLGRRLLGKPLTEQEAREMLASLSGKCHLVVTGFTVIDTDTGKTVSTSVETKVCFRKLSMAEIDAYVKTREPLDKAGAYAIQGMGAVLVEKIEGDYYNVIGLPVSSLAPVLKEFGIRVL